MDISFQKERQHNYIVIRNVNKSKAINYQKRMLEIKSSDNILAHSTRVINGEEYCYYDVTSKLSIKQFFCNRKINMEDIRKIIESLRQVCEMIERFLLDSDRIMLSPDYIFYDLSTAKYSFMYNISTDVEKIKDFESSLLDFFLEYTLADDSDATEYVYSIYEIYEKGSFTIWDMFSMLPSLREETEKVDEKSAIDERDIDAINNNSLYREISVINESEAKKGNVDEQNEELILPKKKSVNYGAITLLIIGIMGIIACIAIGLTMKLSKEESMILLAGGATSILMVAAGVIYMIIYNKKREAIKEHEDQIKEYFNNDWGYDEAFNANRPKMNDFIVSNDKRDLHTNDRDSDEGRISEDDNGQTVYFEVSHNNYKLYALDKKNKIHIELNKLPCTIGKLTEYADCIVDHPSISRLHACINMEKDSLTVTDLNSTNGVFVNGVRLSPSETRIIDVGDEIRFGSLNYCLRSSI